MKNLTNNWILLTVWFGVMSLSPMVTLAQPSIEPLLDTLQVIMKREYIPGAMISIVQADTLLYAGGLGYANVETNEKVTKKHLFRLGSISKSFTALGILRLVNEGKLRLETPVLEIDPSLPLKNKWSAESPIRVENLLEHTAGFDDQHMHAQYNMYDGSAPGTAALVEVHQKSLTARWQPGTYVSYSNPGYVVAGHVIETVSGQPYHSYLQTEVLEPLGMHWSGFYFKPPADALMAQGYKYEGFEYRPIEFASIQGGPAGDLCANAEEMALYLQFMLNRDRPGSLPPLFSDDQFDRIETPMTSLAAQKGLTDGYGLGNGTSWREGFLFHGHNGGIGGFSSLYVYSREANIGVAVSLNKRGNPGVLVNKILEKLLVDVPRKDAHLPIVPLPVEIARRYSGFYAFQNPRSQLTAFARDMVNGISLEAEGDQVIVRDFFGAIEDTLHHSGNQQFFTRNEGIPFAMFLESDEGEPALWIAGDYAEKSSKAVRWFKNILIGVSILMVILCFFFGLIWFPAQLFTKSKKAKFNRLVLWLAALSFVLIPVSFILSVEEVLDVSHPSFSSVTLFLCTLAFFIFSLGTIYFAIRMKKEKAFFTWYYRLTSLCFTGLALFMLFNGLVGFRLWAC